MTVRTKLDIEWSENALERAKQYAAKLSIELQCLGYGVTDAPDYTRPFHHSIQFRGAVLGSVYVGTCPSRRADRDKNGKVVFSWMRRAGAHDIVLTEGSGDWIYLERLTKTVNRLDETLQKVLITAGRLQAADLARSIVEAGEAEAAEIAEFQELQAELVAVEAERDVAWRELNEANAKIDVLIETLEATRRERDELRGCEKHASPSTGLKLADVLRETVGRHGRRMVSEAQKVERLVTAVRTALYVINAQEVQACDQMAALRVVDELHAALDAVDSVEPEFFF